MIVEIGSKIKIKNFNENIRHWCEENLILTNPTWETLKRLGKEDTIKYKHVPEKVKCFVRNGDTLELPFGCLYGIWPFIKDSEINLKLNDNPYSSLFGVKCPVELYDYQKEAVEHMIRAKGGVLVSPCGSGKTFMGIEIIRKLGLKFLWLTHTGDLLRQTYKEFKNLYPFMDIGFITEGKIEIGKDGAISTVQTLCNVNPEEYYKEFDIVICDECAHVSGSPTISKMFSKIIEKIPARYKYGLTATPKRGDTMTDSMYMLIGMSTDGKFAPTFKIDKSKVKTIVAQHMMYPLETVIPMESDVFETDGTIIYNELISFLCEDERRNAIIVRNIKECFEKGRKQVVLCQRVEHCELLAELIAKEGIKVEVATGKTSNKKRNEILNDNADWKVLISTYALLKEGVSIKTLDTLHMTTPVKDKATVVQCVGRIERYLENKKQPIVYDYVDQNVRYCLKAYESRKRSIKNRF